MKALIRIVFLFFIVSLSFIAPYQSLKGQCVNIDFSMGNFTGWQGRTGSCCPLVLPTAGLVAGRHTIMLVPGTDPETGNNLQLICPGYTRSARLGNNNTGYEAEGLSYTYTPTTGTALFEYNYAVVLEDPSHPPAEQPRFEIQVRDQFGNVIPCTLYEVAAGNGIPGFQTFGANRWKDWTTVGVDLTAYIGTPVTIEARTADCGYGGHFGYGYLVGNCHPLEITVDYCIGDTSAILTAPAGFQSYLWSTGQTTQSIVINNPTPGVSNVTCDITSVTGCVATLSTIINPIIAYAGFDWTPDCHYTINFTDTSTAANGIIGGWNWNFGDGNTSTLQNPTHTYAGPGTYDVTLIAATTAGCSDTIVTTITVDEDPVAAFITPDDCGLTVTFTDSSYVPNGLGTITGWEWEFGDLNTSVAQNPTHTYGSANNWNVTLIVTDSRGCTDTLVQPFTSNPYPTAEFTFSNACEGDSTQFTDQSNVLFTTISSWNWDFGGGNTSILQNPYFTFNPPGVYDVQLIVSTPAGCEDTIVHPVTVYPNPVPDFTATEVCEGTTTNFTNLSSIQFGNINSYSWDFDEPTLGGSALTDPSAFYPGDGLYNVTLTAVGDNGCTAEITKPVNVWPKPELDFSADPLAGCWPVSPQFDNLSVIPSGSITTWSWTFGDASGPSSQFEPQHAYPNAPGQYSVTLYAVSDRGCDTSITKVNYITVYPQPTAKFTYDPTYLTIVEPETQFINLSVLGQSYFWDFGDGNNSTQENPYHTYPADTGTYIVELITTNQYGCTDTIEHTIIIHPTFTIYIPNSFTPNADGLNDQFQITGIGLVEAELLIFDRWGEPIARLDKDQAFTIGWDGMYAGTLVKQDVYVYKLRVKDIFGDYHEYHGQINLLP